MQILIHSKLTNQSSQLCHLHSKYSTLEKMSWRRRYFATEALEDCRSTAPNIARWTNVSATTTPYIRHCEHLTSHGKQTSVLLQRRTSVTVSRTPPSISSISLVALAYIHLYSPYMVAKILLLLLLLIIIIIIIINIQELGWRKQLTRQLDTIHRGQKVVVWPLKFMSDSRSLKMARFDRPGTTFYWSAIVTTLYHFPVIWRP